MENKSDEPGIDWDGIAVVWGDRSESYEVHNQAFNAGLLCQGAKMKINKRNVVGYYDGMRFYLKLYGRLQGD